MRVVVLLLLARKLQLRTEASGLAFGLLLVLLVIANTPLMMSLRRAFSLESRAFNCPLPLVAGFWAPVQPSVAQRVCLPGRNSAH